MSVLDLIDRRALNSLGPRHRLFVLEWILDYDAKRAAIACGYSKKTAAVIGARILARNDVHRAVCKIREQISDKYELSLGEVLEQIKDGVTRTTDDLIDPDTGALFTDMRKLSPRAKNVVDGIKQTVREHTDEEGNVDRSVTTEVKLVPKASMIDMALKVKGAYAPVKQQTTVVNFDFDKLYQPPPAPVDPVQKKIEELKLAKSLVQDSIEDETNGKDEEAPAKADGNTARRNGKH